MAEIPTRLRALLDHYRLRWRVVQAAVGLLMTFCAIIGGAGLGVLVDRASLGAPEGVRWALLAAIAVTAVALLVRRVLTPVAKRMGDERTAARLGRNFPNMAEDLVTGVELSRDEDTYSVSEDLVDAALHQIDRRSETVSWRQAVPLDQLARAAALFAVLALAMAMAYVFAPEAVSNSVGRLLRPSREDFFSYTKLNVEPGDQVVCKGDAMQVRVLGLRPPRDARDPGSPPRRRVVVHQRGGRGRRRRRLAERAAPRQPALSRQGRGQHLALVQRPHAAGALADREVRPRDAAGLHAAA